MQEFIKSFAEQLEDTPMESLSGETKFKELEEWDSMTALTIIAMVDEKYGKKLTGNEIREATTISDLFNTIEKK